MATVESFQTAHVRERKAENREFLAAYCALFVVFLVIALASRVLPPGLRPLAAPRGDRRSIWGEARAAAATTAPYVFMK